MSSDAFHKFCCLFVEKIKKSFASFYKHLPYRAILILKTLSETLFRNLVSGFRIAARDSKIVPKDACNPENSEC